MQFFILYKSLSYSIRKSPIQLNWAFLMIFHVSRLFFDQCFTTLISCSKQWPSFYSANSSASHMEYGQTKCASDFSYHLWQI